MQIIHPPITTLILLATKCGFPIQRMRLLGRILILLPNLDRLVGFSGNETKTCFVKRRAHDTSFRLEGAGLCDALRVLEAMSSFPVVKGSLAVVATSEHDVVLVYRQRVDDAVYGGEVLHKVAVGAEPLLCGLCGARGKSEFGGVDGEGANGFLVVGQYCARLSGHEVPEADGAVHAAGEHLGLGFLALDRGDGALVAAQDVDVAARPHVPYADYTVSSSGTQYVYGRVERQGVDAAEMTVVMAYYFVGF